MTTKFQASEPNIMSLLSPSAKELLTASGPKLIKQIGVDAVRTVVYEVLTGKNLRDSTETLTRRRIAALNLALLSMFVKGVAQDEGFVERVPHLASQILQRKGVKKADRWVAQWLLGLTDKAFQNVLRDDPNALDEYRQHYIKTCRQIVEETQKEVGDLAGVLELGSGDKATITWLFMTYLLNAVGSETLTIRGSEKSAYGKLFEKLILGSLLSILGFTPVPSLEPGHLSRVFLLSSRGERRESDATLFFEPGRAVRFDIGFIGRGNAEISLDKVSRFEREYVLHGSHWYVSTIIIVDRIGANSRIEKLAADMGGSIVQMSMGYWPQQVARELNKALGYHHPLVDMEPSQIGPYLREKLAEVSFDDIIRVSDT